MEAYEGIKWNNKQEQCNIEFPDNISMGLLYSRERDIFDESKWINFRKARGSIIVPKDKDLRLEVDNVGATICFY